MTSRQAPLLDIADGPPGGQAYWTTTSDGVRIRVAIWPGDGAGTVILFTGRTEYIEKYGPTAARLVSRGYSVVVFDWRGQGLSDRDPKAGILGHVNDFMDFQKDVEAVLQLDEVRNLPRPRIQFCHSMGGCIGLRSLVGGLDVERSVFSSPMWGLEVSGLNRMIVLTLAFFARLTGQSTRLAISQEAEPFILTSGFEGNELTSDEETYRWLVGHLESHPELAVGGPTIGWLAAALRETRALAEASPPSLPILTTLGTDEKIVFPEAIHQQIGRMPNAELVLVEGGRHETWMETAAKQEAAWQSIDGFLSRGS